MNNFGNLQENQNTQPQTNKCGEPENRKILAILAKFPPNSELPNYNLSKPIQLVSSGGGNMRGKGQTAAFYRTCYRQSVV